MQRAERAYQSIDIVGMLLQGLVVRRQASLGQQQRQGCGANHTTDKETPLIHAPSPKIVAPVLSTGAS